MKHSLQIFFFNVKCGFSNFDPYGPPKARVLPKKSFFWCALSRRVSLVFNRFHRSKKYVGAVVRQIHDKDRSRPSGRPLGGWRAWHKPYNGRGPTSQNPTKIRICGPKILKFSKIFKIFKILDFHPQSIPVVPRHSARPETLV